MISFLWRILENSGKINKYSDIIQVKLTNQTPLCKLNPLSGNPESAPAVSSIYEGNSMSVESYLMSDQLRWPDFHALFE